MVVGISEVCMFDVLTKLLTSSSPEDGLVFDVKSWILTWIVEPSNMVVYRYGFTDCKPSSLYTPEDLL